MELAGLIITGCIGVLTIIAIALSPLIALKIQEKLQEHRESRKKKFDIFKTLMATRGDKLSLDHVKALNMIDIEFYNEQEIKNEWNVYRDQLNTNPGSQGWNEWNTKIEEYFANLLYAMSKFFDYNFDKVIIKKGAYSPQAHGSYQNEMSQIRAMAIDVLQGKKPVHISLFPGENNTNQPPANAEVPEAVEAS
jgi:hypothetical protein